MVDNLPIDVRSVANYVLSERERFGLATTPLSLQKLLFFCYVNFLTRYEEPLFDGYFEAWEHGPVHPYIWRELRLYGKDPISNFISSKDLISGDEGVVPFPESYEVRALISEIVLQTRKLTASQLRKLSHVPNGPWERVWKAREANLASSARIPDNVLLSYYRGKMWAVVPQDVGDADVEDNPPEPYRGRE